MPLTRILYPLLVVALLGAWQGALVHPLIHAEAHRVPPAFSGAPLPQLPDGSASGLRCDVLAAVAVCIGSAADSFRAHVAGNQSAQEVCTADIAVAQLLAYHSQAPPPVLL